MTETKQHRKKPDKPMFDLRQTKMLKVFLDPTNKKYFGNALQSAIYAGYSEKYAKNITIQAPWLEEAVVEILGKPTDKKNLVIKAKKVLNECLDSKDERIKQDTAKFVAKTDPEFSEKQDITSGGNALVPTVTVKFAEPTDEWKSEHGDKSQS